MILSDKIDILDKTGNWLRSEFPDQIVDRSIIQNPWFTKEHIRHALISISNQYFNARALNSWLSAYPINESLNKKTVGLVLAGNIPMVGMHDVICTFLAGHKSKIKFAEKDSILIPEILNYLISQNPDLAQWFENVEKLKEYDAVIATGSNQTAVYFSKYFSNVPHIIRKNRHAIAIIDGNENITDLKKLADDIFLYFGLGCRNVSKIFVPNGYDFNPLLTKFNDFSHIIQHHKYCNNYDYNKALYLLNKEPFLEHPCILLKESEAISSRIASLHFQYYNSIDEVNQFIKIHHDEIQCIVGSQNTGIKEIISYGNAQQPSADTYADGIDTMKFLSQL